MIYNRFISIGIDLNILPGREREGEEENMIECCNTWRGYNNEKVENKVEDNGNK